MISPVFIGSSAGSCKPGALDRSGRIHAQSRHNAPSPLRLMRSDALGGTAGFPVSSDGWVGIGQVSPALPAHGSSSSDLGAASRLLGEVA